MRSAGLGSSQQHGSSSTQPSLPPRPANSQPQHCLLMESEAEELKGGMSGIDSNLTSDDSGAEDDPAQAQSCTNQGDNPDTGSTESAQITASGSGGDRCQPASSYFAAVEARNAATAPAPTTARSYSIQPLLSIPHATQVNAFTAPPCYAHLYSGGADGYIRQHSILMLDPRTKTRHAVNQSNLYSQLPTQPDSLQPVLVGYWENEEQAQWTDDLLANVGPQGSLTRG